MELFSQFLDQLTEVDTTVSGVIEYSFCSISLIFNIIELHLQFQTRCDLTASVQCVVLLTYGLDELLHVVDSCATVNLFQLADRRIVFLAFALFLDELAHHGHYSDVMSDSCFHRN